jgi:hypothetical protein
MRKLKTALFLSLQLLAITAAAQTQIFDRQGIEYRLDLPTPAWKAVSRLDVHDHVEFVYGADKLNGYLRLRKNQVDAGATATELFRRDEKWDLQALPGYVMCGECEGEKLIGNLSGLVFSYEYTSGGRQMAGRIYYLQVDKRTFYTLHFTLARDKLLNLREQMDSIARSIRLK